MFNKLKKFLKSKRAVGSVATAIKVGTACVLGATVLVGGVALTQDVVLPNTSDKVQNVAEYEGDGAGGGSTGGVVPVNVPVVYDHDAPELHPTGILLGGDHTEPQNGDTYECGDYIYTYYVDDGVYRYAGWNVSVGANANIHLNRDKTIYGPILESINGVAIINMEYTFTDCDSLLTPPTIPINVKNMCNCFVGCDSLTTAPEIPNSVIHMDYCFQGCESLTTAPEIPNSVISMGSTFSGCDSLMTAPIIPNSVTVISATFMNCTSLTGTITINANPTQFGHCLRNTQITEVAGDTTLKSEILATKDDVSGGGSND